MEGGNTVDGANEKAQTVLVDQRCRSAAYRGAAESLCMSESA